MIDASLPSEFSLVTPPTAKFPLRLMSPTTVSLPPTYVFPRASTENCSTGRLPLKRYNKLYPDPLFPAYPEIRLPVVKLELVIVIVLEVVAEL